ncbi:MAG: PD-(D/E)XK nuclease family protein, partial [Nitrospiria bacterium]
MKDISRSAIETFLSCRRKGYLQYIYKGKGFVGPKAPYFVIGLVVHKGLEILFRSLGDLPAALKEAEKEFHSQLEGTTITADWKETLNLAKALIIGWFRARWNSFNADYEVLSIEEEVRSILAPNITLSARADLVVRERLTGQVFVFNWKTSGDKKDFTLKWAEEVQAWTEVLAIQDHLGEEVSGCIFEGLYKGGVSTAAAYKGASNSPLVRGFQHTDGRISWESESGKDWRRTAPAEQSGGLEAWIDLLPLEVVEAQFMRSAPIFKNDEVVRDWLEQVVRMVTDIQRMLEPDVPERDRLAFFTQSFGHFRCSGCYFKPVCFKEFTVEEMVELGKL